jgi:glycosyltransferase involved in cell wall biosynthesis
MVPGSSNSDIIFVTNSLTGGGAERATNILVNELFDQGINVKLMVINDGTEDLVTPKCHVFKIGRKWQGSALDTIRAFYRVQLILLRQKPVAIVLNCDLPEFLGCMIYYKGETIIVEHAAKPWPSRNLFGKIVRFVHHLRGTHFVAVSSHLSIWPKGDLPARVLPNAIDQNVFMSSHNFRIESKMRLMHVGRLVESKQPDWVLTISKRTEIACAFIGVGPLEPEMKKQAEVDKIDAQFLGQATNPYDLFNPLDLLLITSRNEGDGLVLIEAIALKLPFLILDISDFDKFQIPETNKCVDISEFEQKVLAYKNGSIDLRLNKQDSQRILRGRSPASVADLWLEFLGDDLKLTLKSNP